MPVALIADLVDRRSKTVEMTMATGKRKNSAQSRTVTGATEAARKLKKFLHKKISESSWFESYIHT